MTALVHAYAQSLACSSSGPACTPKPVHKPIATAAAPKIAPKPAQAAKPTATTPKPPTVTTSSAPAAVTCPFVFLSLQSDNATHSLCSRILLVSPFPSVRSSMHCSLPAKSVSLKMFPTRPLLPRRCHSFVGSFIRSAHRSDHVGSNSAKDCQRNPRCRWPPQTAS